MLPLNSAQIGKTWDDWELYRTIIQNKNTTIEAFESYCAENPSYQFEDRVSPSGSDTLAHLLLNRDKDENSYKLLSHIIKVGGKNVLNCGDKNGATLLLKCIFDRAHFPGGVGKDSDTFKAIALCHLGADVNSTNAQPLKSTFLTDVPAGTTPLWLAAEKTNDLDLVITLLQCGAHTGENPLSRVGKDKIATAKAMIQYEIDTQYHCDPNCFNSLLAAMTDQQCLLDRVPLELIPTLDHYNVSLLERKLLKDYSSHAEENNLPIKALFNIKV